MVEGILHHLLRNIQKNTHWVGYMPMPNPGPSVMLLIHRPTKVIVCSATRADIFDKKKTLLVNITQFPSGIETFSRIFTKQQHDRQQPIFGKKPQLIFYCRCLLQRSGFSPPGVSFAQNQSQIILVPVCLYLAITPPNLDANIVFFIKSTSKVLMVTQCLWQVSHILLKGGLFLVF